jgi:NADH-quinone oxidoreductase subunit D
MQIWKDRERTMDVLERLTGNRVNYGMNTVGGARRDVDDDERRMVLDALRDLEEKMKPIVHWLTTDRTVAMRTKGVGKSPN